MRDKHKLTEVLLSHWTAENPETLERALSLWWHNIRKSGGLRLTDIGYFALNEVLRIESYAMDIDQIDRQTMLSLDRKLQMPYYIKTKKKIPIQIVFFGSKEAMLAKLYGNLTKFLDNYWQNHYNTQC